MVCLCGKPICRADTFPWFVLCQHLPLAEAGEAQPKPSSVAPHDNYFQPKILEFSCVHGFLDCHQPQPKPQPNWLYWVTNNWN